jgi:hypothetical protein
MVTSVIHIVIALLSPGIVIVVFQFACGLERGFPFVLVLPHARVLVLQRRNYDLRPLREGSSASNTTTPF